MKTSRRNFLAGVSSSALLILSSGTSNAWKNGSAATLFNNGKSQINMGFMSFGGMFPFINCVLTSQTCSNITGGGAVDPSLLSSDGYPVSVSNGGITTIFDIPTQAERPGNYVLSFTATSAGNTVAVPGVTTCVASGAGVQTFSISAASLPGLNQTTWSYNGSRTRCRVTINITTTGVSGVAFYHVNDSSAFAANQARGLTWGGFGSLFLSSLSAMRVGVIRFLNWQGDGNQGGNGNMTKWAYRKMPTYLSFNANTALPLQGCGSTAGSGDTFTLTGNGTGVPLSGGPVDRVPIIANLDRAGSTTANTLSLNGTTALPLLDAKGNALKVAAGWSVLIYDSVLNGYLVYPGISGVTEGCPVEVMAELAYQLGAHPRFVTPYLAHNPQTDYMSSAAALIKTNYQDSGKATWMIPRYEGPNEQWNSVFNANNYSVNAAVAWWGRSYGGSGGGDHFWYGNGLSQLGQNVCGVYGSPNPKTQTKYRIICGVQSGTYANGSGNPNTSASNPRLSSSRLTGFQSATFTGGGSANISVAGNTFSANDPVEFNASSFPTGLAIGQVVYVKTTGSTITVSATPGGTALTFASAGSGVNIIASSASPAYNWATSVCCTNYINPNVQNTNSEFQSAYDYFITYAADPTQQAAILASYCATNDVQYWSGNGTIVGTTLTINSTISGAPIAGSSQGVLLGAGVAYNTTIVSGSGPYTISPSQNVGPVSMTQDGLLVSYQAWQSWGASFASPVTRLEPYEGGWSPDYVADIGTAPAMTVSVTAASNTNPCVLTIANNSTTYFSNSGRQNLQTYPGNMCVQVNFTGAWAGLAGIYEITAGSNGSITIALDASAQPSPFSTTIVGQYFVNLSTATATISPNAGTTFSSMTVGGWSGDAILVGATVFWGSAPFNGQNGYPKVMTFGTGTGGNGTYTLAGTATATSQSVQIFVEPWWIVNILRYNSKSAPALQSMLVQNYTDVVTNTTGGEFPSCFDFSNGGVWGIAEPDLYGLANSPQYAGIVQFNN